ncbi:hypothetical protein D3C81_1068780 [compost metagenome]
MQRLNHALPVAAQSLHHLPQTSTCSRRPNPRERLAQLCLPQGHQGFQISGEARGRTRTTEVGTDVIVTTALGNGLANARYEGREYDASVIVIAAQLAEVEIQRQLREACSQCIGNGFQLRKRGLHRRRRPGQALASLGEHFAPAAQFSQRTQHCSQIGRQRFGQCSDFIHRLALQGVEQQLLHLAG